LTEAPRAYRPTLAVGITALDHKTRNNTVKSAGIIKLFAYQAVEVAHMPGSYAGIQFNVDDSKCISILRGKDLKTGFTGVGISKLGFQATCPKEENGKYIEFFHEAAFVIKIEFLSSA
jgi:hypothetical protein